MAETSTVETDVPARLDRLPWSSWHWRVVIGLGTVWILDGLEITVVGVIGARLGQKNTLGLGASQIGLAGTLYVIGACLGALVFGHLTDRLGRKRLFVATLALYLLAVVATAFSPTIGWFYVCRFFTGAGIGGEYAAINSAIDELIPARVRGTTDLVINGSYWLGTALAAALSLVMLNTNVFGADLGWRLMFGLGALLGLGILWVRRNVPESPRWMFIHGHAEEAERLVGSIEDEVREDTGEKLEEPGETITIHQRKTIGFGEIARTMITRYPRRAVLGLSLFIGQAFLYNAVFFTYATVLSTFFKVPAGNIGLYLLPFAVGNFLGPVIMGRLFDTVGRRPMIAGSYIVSGVLLLVTAILFEHGTFGAWGLTAAWSVIFFFASAGASSAYLTVSEIFPMETRALAIAFFYAVGTGLGGAIGPLLFGKLIATGKASQVLIGYAIGAGMMIGAGLVEAFLGVDAEQRALEDVAQPLTAQEADGKKPQRRRDRERRPSTGWSPRPSWSSYPAQDPWRAVEVDRLASALAQHGPVTRRRLCALAGARRWGPGRYSAALRAALRGGRIQRMGRAYGAAPQEGVHERATPRTGRSPQSDRARRPGG